jgi:hypothetical protein
MVVATLLSHRSVGCNQPLISLSSDLVRPTFLFLHTKKAAGKIRHDRSPIRRPGCLIEYQLALLHATDLADIELVYIFLYPDVEV